MSSVGYMSLKEYRKIKGLEKHICLWCMFTQKNNGKAELKKNSILCERSGGDYRNANIFYGCHTPHDFRPDFHSLTVF